MGTVAPLEVGVGKIAVDLLAVGHVLQIDLAVAVEMKAQGGIAEIPDVEGDELEAGNLRVVAIQVEPFLGIDEGGEPRLQVDCVGCTGDEDGEANQGQDTLTMGDSVGMKRDGVGENGPAALRRNLHTSRGGRLPRPWEGPHGARHAT